jgi:hypothetical protein
VDQGHLPLGSKAECWKSNDPGEDLQSLDQAHAADFKSCAFCTFESVQISRRTFGLDAKQSHFGSTRRTLKKGGEWFALPLWLIHNGHQAPIFAR